MNKRLFLLIFALVISALSLAACGGGGSSDESQIEAAIENSATIAEASNCTELETANFIEQSTSESGKAALKTCEENEEETDSKAESVAVSKVEVEGSTATAEAAITGGGLGGQTLMVELVEEDGQWKLNEITEFVKLDTKALAAAFETQIEESGELEPEQTSCIGEAVAGATKPEAEELILSGSSDALVEVIEACE